MDLTIVYDTETKTFKRASLGSRALPDVRLVTLGQFVASVTDTVGNQLLPTASTSAPTAPKSTSAPTAPRATAADGEGDPYLDATETAKAVEDIAAFMAPYVQASPAQAPSEDRA